MAPSIRPSSQQPSPNGGAKPQKTLFSHLKGHRFVTNRRLLAEAGESVACFLKQGIVELGEKLGPILWQFAPTKKFDADDIGAFLELLPEKQDGVKLRHALEVRHQSFVVPEFIALARKHNVAIVYADHATYPAIADVTGDFVYARLQTGEDDVPTCYQPKALDQWVNALKPGRRAERRTISHASILQATRR